MPARDSEHPHLFPSFPGYGPGRALDAELVFDSRTTRSVPRRRVEEALKAQDQVAKVQGVTDAILEELVSLKEKAVVDVFVCALPEDVLRLRVQQDRFGEEARENSTTAAEVRGAWDLHDSLKAKAMRLGRPMQLALPSTFGVKLSSSIRKEIGAEAMPKLQDEATRAWNLYVALYYKAGGTPWRMVRASSDLSTCFVGISFFRSLDRESVHTTLAEVFNERGEGVIVRGAEAVTTKKDRQPHLSGVDAEALLSSALSIYRREHRTLPARIVVHKTSRFEAEELEGLKAAVSHKGLEYADYVDLQRDSLRLFRLGAYPPLRGTYLDTEESELFLYTRGSVPFFETYPGMYVPRTLRVRVAEAESDVGTLGREVLSLTKMNWNNTQFDNGDPITIRAARQVGRLLKYLDPADPAEHHYAFYM